MYWEDFQGPTQLTYSTGSWRTSGLSLWSGAYRHFLHQSSFTERNLFWRTAVIKVRVSGSSRMKARGESWRWTLLLHNHLHRLTLTLLQLYITPPHTHLSCCMWQSRLRRSLFPQSCSGWFRFSGRFSQSDPVQSAPTVVFTLLLINETSD